MIAVRNVDFVTRSDRTNVDIQQEENLQYIERLWGCGARAWYDLGSHLIQSGAGLKLLVVMSKILTIAALVLSLNS